LQRQIRDSWCFASLVVWRTGRECLLPYQLVGFGGVCLQRQIRCGWCCASLLVVDSLKMHNKILGGVFDM